MKDLVNNLKIVTIFFLIALLHNTSRAQNSLSEKELNKKQNPCDQTYIATVYEYPCTPYYNTTCTQTDAENYFLSQTSSTLGPITVSYDPSTKQTIYQTVTADGCTFTYECNTIVQEAIGYFDNVSMEGNNCSQSSISTPFWFTAESFIEYPSPTGSYRAPCQYALYNITTLPAILIGVFNSGDTVFNLPFGKYKAMTASVCANNGTYIFGAGIATQSAYYPQPSGNELHYFTSSNSVSFKIPVVTSTQNATCGNSNGIVNFHLLDDNQQPFNDIVVITHQTLGVIPQPTNVPFAYYYNNLPPGNYTIQSAQGAVNFCTYSPIVNFTIGNTNILPVTNINQAICSNQYPYSWNGLNITSAGTYTVHLNSALGCDSIVTLTLTTKVNTASITNASICSNQLPYSWNNNSYTSAGTYTVHLTNAAGCDSAATLNLVVKHETYSYTTLTICPSQLPYNFNGIVCSSDGIYTTSIANSQGCDSILTLDLRVLPNYTPSQFNVKFEPHCYNSDGVVYLFFYNSTANPNTPYRVENAVTNSIVASGISNGNNFVVISGLSGGTYNVYAQNCSGAYSLSTVFVLNAIQDASCCNININGNAILCENQSAQYLTNIQGGTWSSSDIGVATVSSTGLVNTVASGNCYIIYSKTQNGITCGDTIKLTVKATSSSLSIVNICQNQLPYFWNGNSYTQAGRYLVRFTNTVGCDSLANLNLYVNSTAVQRDTLHLSNCGSVYYNGINYYTSTTLQDTIRTYLGCDSLYRVVYITIPAIPNASITNPSNVSLGTTLNLANASTAKQIDWYLNGNKVSTIHHASNITPTTVAGGNGYGNANNQADYPYCVALDAAGNLYTVNTNFHSVEKWNTITNTKTIVAGGNSYGNAANQLNQPRGIFIDNSNNIYIADGENHRIVKWAPNATSGTVVAGGNGAWNNADQLNYPSAVFVDASNNIYIADEFNNRIQKWALNATSGVTVAGNFHFGTPVINNTELNHPAGVFVKSNGDIYVADMFNNRVQKFVAGSSVATTVAGQADGSAGNDACHLHFPHALYVDANDNVFVADGYNNRVQKWAPNATSGITVAGGEGNSFTNGIEALAMNANGDMYCGSVGMQSVTKWINPNPTINTTFTPTTTGNYYAVITFDNCCQLTTNSVDVNAYRPGTPITGNPKSCTLNTTTQLKNSNKNGVWKSSNTSVAGVNQSGLVTSLTNGITTISYTYTLSGFTYQSTVDFVVAYIPNPAAIVGSPTLCVGSSTMYTSSTPNGVWGSSGRLSISNGGVATGTSAGNTAVSYTVSNNSGCSATAIKAVIVNALPAVPTISFAPGTIGISGNGGYCKNKTFTLIGNPTNGTWNSAGVISISSLGVVNTGNTIGPASVTYNYTNTNGCSNSRTISSNIINCALKPSSQTVDNINVAQLYPNPANSFVNINMNKLTGNGQVIIYDLLGKQVKKQSLSMGNNRIDIGFLLKGIYLVSIITDDNKQTEKLIVE